MTDILEFQGSNRWLSNFEGPSVLFDRVRYKRVENAYQAGKTLDPKIRESFVSVPAGMAKQMGKPGRFVGS